MVSQLWCRPLGKQGKFEGFVSCDWPNNLTETGFKSSIFSLCDLEIWWMTSQTIGHFFYTQPTFSASFKSISESKLELQSGNAQFGSKLAIFCPVRPWNSIDDLEKQKGTSSILHQAMCIISNPSMNPNWSYTPEMLNLGRNWRYLVPRELDICWMTLENDRAPLLYYIKLCASF